MEVRFILTFAFILGLLYLAGCGWLFPKPESPLTEEEARAILSTLDEGAKLYQQLTSEGNPNAAALVAEWLRNFPEVANTSVGEDNSIYITYKCGLPAVIFSYEHMMLSSEGLSAFHSVEKQSARENCCALLNTYAPSSATGVDSRQCQKKAAIFAFNKEFYETGFLDNESVGEKIKKSLESMGYCVEVWYGSEFNLKRLEQLDQYHVIIFRTHGGLSPTGNVCFCTGEPVDLLKLRRYISALIGKGIGVGKLPDEKGEFITFDQYFIMDKNLHFPNSLVLALGCESLKSESMADAFLHKGAALYLGWTDVVNTHFEFYFLSNFFASGQRWPCGWSVSDILNRKFKWPLGLQPVASLLDVFGDPDRPPTNSFCGDKLVGYSLPALTHSVSLVDKPCNSPKKKACILRWKGQIDLVLNPSGGPICQELLDISFTPTVVPFEISSTEGLGWVYTVTISEKKGFTVKLNRLRIESYDANGNLLAMSEWDERGFFKFFNTDKVDPNTSISARILEWPRPYYSHAVVVWKIFGTNSYEDHLQISGEVQLQQNAERGLKVDIGPPTLLEDKWVYEVSISEIRGVKTNLMGMLVICFDELRLSTNCYTGNIDQLFGTHVIPENGYIKTTVAQPYDPADRSLAWVVAGVDDKGTMVYGSGVAVLTLTSGVTNGKAGHQNVKVIIPLAPLLEGIE